MFAQDEEEAGLLEQVKSQICDNVALYAQKYDEEFSPQLPQFVTAIWHLLLTTGQQVKYDLVSVQTLSAYVLLATCHNCNTTWWVTSARDKVEF